MLTDMLIKFHDSILKCDKSITRNLAIIQAKDCRSDFGRNIYVGIKVLSFSSILKRVISNIFPSVFMMNGGF